MTHNQRIEPNVPWTVEEVRLLRELADQGMTRREIAKRINRSMDSIGGKLRKLGVKGAPVNRTHGPGGRFQPQPKLVHRAGRSTLPPLPSLSEP